MSEEQKNLEEKLINELDKRKHKLGMQDRRDANEDKESAMQQAIADARLELKNEIPRHKKYQGLVTFYT